LVGEREPLVREPEVEGSQRVLLGAQGERHVIEGQEWLRPGVRDGGELGIQVGEVVIGGIVGVGEAAGAWAAVELPVDDPQQRGVEAVAVRGRRRVDLPTPDGTAP
jgi:hypothetical protein